MMMVVNAFLCLFEYYMAIFLVIPGKPSFRRLDFNVGLRYRKSSFREETSRCQPVKKKKKKKKKHLDVDFKGLTSYLEQTHTPCERDNR